MEVAALREEAKKGVKACRAVLCNKFQCKVLATLLEYFIRNSTDEWDSSANQEVTYELTRVAKAARYLACDYGKELWISSALMSQVNPLEFQSIVDDAGQYLTMLKQGSQQNLEQLVHELKTSLEEGAIEDRAHLFSLSKERGGRHLITEATYVLFDALSLKLEGGSYEINRSRIKIDDGDDSFLGRGNGAGGVSKGLWMKTVPVAIKLFSTDNLRLDNEIGIMESLQHPNIVRFLGMSTSPDRNTRLLVMELMEKDLKKLIVQEHENLTWRDKVDIMIQIAKGMEYLHSNNVCYRDLKPQNVLVKKRPPFYVIKLADFGHSRNNFESMDTGNTTRAGTPGYMAPECLDEGQTYSKKADVFSFALTCAELLSGEVFSSSGETMFQIRRKLETGERPVLPPYCPPGLKEVMNRCWSFDPEERPAFSELIVMIWDVKKELIYGESLIVERGVFYEGPKFPYLVTKTDRWARLLKAALRRRSFWLHFMCEHASGCHEVVNQQGIKITLYPGFYTKHLAPAFVYGSIRPLRFLLRKLVILSLFPQKTLLTYNDEANKQAGDLVKEKLFCKIKGSPLEAKTVLELHEFFKDGLHSGELDAFLKSRDLVSELSLTQQEVCGKSLWLCSEHMTRSGTLENRQGGKPTMVHEAMSLLLRWVSDV